ncbi:MAG: hypothetical protein WC748_02415 [Legionellales bacterium]|jgi:hypothetical protein
MFHSKKLVEMKPHNKPLKESPTQEMMSDLALAEKLWGHLQDNPELTSRNFEKILVNYGFTINSDSGSSHYNVQAPKELKGFGSFTLTSKLNKYLIKKMVEKNFTQFFNKYAPEKIDKILASSSQTKDDLPKALTLPAYNKHIQDEQPKKLTKEELKQNLLVRARSIFEKIEDKAQLKIAIEAIEPELNDFKEILTLCYLKWLGKLETLEESIPVIQKLAELSAEQVVKSSSFLTDTIPTLIYYFYAEHISNLMLQLKSENLEKIQRFLIIEQCIDLNIHVISMLRPPIPLHKPKYPIVIFEKTASVEWIYALKNTSLAYITSCTNMLVNLDKALGTIGQAYDIAPTQNNSSPSPASAVNQKKNEAVKMLIQAYEEVVVPEMMSRPTANVAVIKLDWHLVALVLADAQVCKYHFRIIHATLKENGKCCIELIESAISLLKFSRGSPKNLEELRKVEETDDIIIGLQTLLPMILFNDGQSGKAMSALREIIKKFDKQKDLAEKSANDRIQHEIMNCIDYLINHIETNHNLIYYIEICELSAEFAELDPCNIIDESESSTIYNQPKVAAILGALNIAARCLVSLDLLKNSDEKKILNDFTAQKFPSIVVTETRYDVKTETTFTVKTATEAFQKLLLKKQFDLSASLAKLDKKSMQIQAQWQEPSRSSSSNAGLKIKKK